MIKIKPFTQWCFRKKSIKSFMNLLQRCKYATDELSKIKSPIWINKNNTISNT